MRAPGLLAAAVLILAPAAALARPIPLDEVRVVQLDAKGETTTAVRLKSPGVLELDVFSAPDAAGDIGLEVLGPDGEPLPAGAIAGPGEIKVRIKAQQPMATPVQLRLRADPSIDGFEPNNARGMARRAALPFDGWIETAPGDQDWFRIDAPKGGVVGVGFAPIPDARLHVYDASGKPVADSPREGVINGGITYVSAIGGTMYVMIDGSQSYQRTVTRLTITRYDAPDRGDGAVVSVGLEGDDQTTGQLALAAKAAGARAVAANDDSVIDTVLSDSLARPKAEGARLWWIVAAAVAVIAAAGAGFWVWRRRAGHKTATPEPAADQPAEPREPDAT